MFTCAGEAQEFAAELWDLDVSYRVMIQQKKAFATPIYAVVYLAPNDELHCEAN